MTQPNLAEPYDPEAIADYRRKAREFLGQGYEYWSAGDLHQASEKGWRAAAWMAKAVAVAHGLDYQHHAQFGVVLNHARRWSGNPRLRDLRRAANEMHSNFYTREKFLDASEIDVGLDDMAELLDILEPLAIPGDGQGDG